MVHGHGQAHEYTHCTINVPRLPLGRCYRTLAEHARGQYPRGRYNADFYVGGAVANTFPMMRKGTAGHAIRPPVGYFT